MFEEIENINTRPEPFEFYTASDLWTDEHTSKQMLTYHLNEDIDMSSRNSEFISRSVEWIVSRFNVGAGTKIADFGCGPGLYATKLAQRRNLGDALDKLDKTAGGEIYGTSSVYKFILSGKKPTGTAIEK